MSGDHKSTEAITATKPEDSGLLSEQELQLNEKYAKFLLKDASVSRPRFTTASSSSTQQELNMQESQDWLELSSWTLVFIFVVLMVSLGVCSYPQTSVVEKSIGLI